MIRRLLLLIGGALAFWVLTALPAHALGGGSQAVVFSGTAVLLCLAPTAASLVWAELALSKDPQTQLLMVLGGTGLRMFFVLAGGMALYLLVPYFQDGIAFWLWVMAVYPVTLALDVALILLGRSAAKA